MLLKAKKRKSSLTNPDAIGADGLLEDLDIQSIDEETVTREDKQCDVDQFFHAAFVRDVNRKQKKYRTCKSCP